MPIYTVQEIVAMPNPYGTLFQDNDHLARNYNELQQLSLNQKIELVTNVVFQCPANRLKALHRTSHSLYHHLETDESIHALLVKALDIRQRLQAIADSRHPAPHHLLLGKEFNADFYNKFFKLTIMLANDLAIPMASNLAIHTPDDKTRQLMRNIRSSFRDTMFAEKMGQALLVNKLLKDLTGDNPGKIFASQDFNVNLFHQFPTLVERRLPTHELNIASKLAKLPAEQHAHISKSLLSLYEPPMASSFLLIHHNFCHLTGFTPSIDDIEIAGEEDAQALLIGRNPHRFLNHKASTALRQSDEEKESLILRN